MLDGQARKVASFAVRREIDVESPTSIQRVPTGRSIRRVVTPFSHMFYRHVSEIDDDDEESSSKPTAAVEQGPGEGGRSEVTSEEAIMQR